MMLLLTNQDAAFCGAIRVGLRNLRPEGIYLQAPTGQVGPNIC